jgi:DNA-binding transcriptional LysR family regulator
VLTLGDGEAMVVAAQAGLGLTQVPYYMAEHALRDGSLVELLSHQRPAPDPIAAVVQFIAY